MKNNSQELWSEAENRPLSNQLRDKSIYMFLGMTPNVEELDESEKLSDMKLMLGAYYAIVLKVVEKPLEADKQNVQKDIAKLLDMDISRNISADFEEDSEVKERSSDSILFPSM